MVVTDDPGSKPDQKYARRRDRQNYMGRISNRNSLVCNILFHCEGVDFKVTGIKFMIVFIRRKDAACF